MRNKQAGLNFLLLTFNTLSPTLYLLRRVVKQHIKVLTASYSDFLLGVFFFHRFIATFPLHLQNTTSPHFGEMKLP